MKMLLSNFIKALTDVAIQAGECEVFITTQNESETYDTALIHCMPSVTTEDKQLLRIEGIVDPESEEEDYD